MMILKMLRLKFEIIRKKIKNKQATQLRPANLLARFCFRITSVLLLYALSIKKSSIYENIVAVGRQWVKNNNKNGILF